MRAVALNGGSDVIQTLALTPRGELFPRVRMWQIRIRGALRLLKLVQGRRQSGEEVALVRLERAAGERRLRKAGKQEALAGPKPGAEQGVVGVGGAART